MWCDSHPSQKHQNITCKDTWINNCDGDGLVVSDSNIVNIDAGSYDE